MGSETVDGCKLRIYFFPFTAAGHFFPMLNMAKLFSSHPTVDSVTVITTPSNGRHVTPSPKLNLLLLPLPPTSLPHGWDSTSFTSSHADFHSIHTSLSLLRGDFLRLLRSNPPHCLVSDMFLPWTADVAAELRIPRLVFHGMSFFSLSVLDRIERHKPHELVGGEHEPFLVPGLPGPVEMTRADLPAPLRSRDDRQFNSLMDQMAETESLSYGVVVNSFYELEAEFADFYRDSIGKRAWHVGPLSSLNKLADVDDPAVSWLEGKKPGSVLYVCFGSQVRFTEEQTRELAAGLVRSEHCFLWVTKKDDAPINVVEDENGRGKVIRGWAPQVAILNHEAVGGFLTHCGWNSVLEGVSAGVPMVTWSVYGDQIFNEKLVVEKLGIGAKVGGAVDIEMAVKSVMGGGEEAVEMRRRARRLGELAGRAVEEGGSSRKDMDRLFKELMQLQGAKEEEEEEEEDMSTDE